ncbi:MAG: hypothetical protein P8Z79_05900 [Sedimentisphaerales bacterium]|jgi:hypothetical protein
MPVSQVAEKRMTLPNIRVKAKALSLRPGRMKKVDLIHAIQIAEGCTPCYGRSDGNCPYGDCCFRKDCIPLKP